MKIQITAHQFVATLEIPQGAYKQFSLLQTAIRNESGDLTQAIEQGVIWDLLLLLDGLGNWAGDLPEVFEGNNRVTLTPLTFADAWELANQTVSSTVNLVTTKNANNEQLQTLASKAETLLKRCQEACLENPNGYSLATLQSEIRRLQSNYKVAYQIYLDGIRNQPPTETA